MKNAIEKEKELIRDRLYDAVRNTYYNLLHGSVDVVQVERQINEWENLLLETEDISCRQIIKEGINDCLRLRKTKIEAEIRLLRKRERAVRELAQYSFDDDINSIFAQARMCYSSQGSMRNMDGDVLTFFGNGDIHVE